MQHNYPKILIVSRNVWDDKKGTSSTLSNLFQNFNPDILSQIYIETKMPNTICCNRFFQISEYSIIRRNYNKKVKTGKEITCQDISDNDMLSEDAIKEEKIMAYVRRNRSWIYTCAREFLWKLNGWKSEELKCFLSSVSPDVLFLCGSPLILINRMHNYIIKQTGKPAAFFLMDDVYTYKSCGKNPLDFIHKFFLRISVKKIINKCNTVFVASPKMKKEYDAIFGIKSIFLTKGIDFTKNPYIQKETNSPIRIVYLGQLIYGRCYSIAYLVKALREINSSEIKAQLFVYTGNFISKEMREALEIENTSYIMPLVPYEQVSHIMSESDIVLFVESLNTNFINLARLSFSTKITDYFSSGKCIFAIGNKDIAPIEYLKEQDAAIIASSELEIKNNLINLINKPELIAEYSKKSYQCGKRNHDKNEVLAAFNDNLINTIKFK